MNKLAMIVVLVLLGFSVKAQQVNNNTDCDVEIAYVCFSCPYTGTTPATPSFTTVFANSSVAKSAPSCGTGSYIGVIVRYALCPGSQVKITVPTTPTPCAGSPFIPNSAFSTTTCGDPCSNITAAISDNTISNFTVDIN